MRQTDCTSQTLKPFAESKQSQTQMLDFSARKSIRSIKLHQNLQFFNEEQRQRRNNLQDRRQDKNLLSALLRAIDDIITTEIDIFANSSMQIKQQLGRFARKSKELHQQMRDSTCRRKQQIRSLREGMIDRIQQRKEQNRVSLARIEDSANVILSILGSQVQELKQSQPMAQIAAQVYEKRKAQLSQVLPYVQFPDVAGLEQQIRKKIVEHKMAVMNLVKEQQKSAELFTKAVNALSKQIQDEILEEARLREQNKEELLQCYEDIFQARTNQKDSDEDKNRDSRGNELARQKQMKNNGFFH